MNSTELYIAAGDAICEWGKLHNDACFLYIEDGQVICQRAQDPPRLQNNPLLISKFEIERGMKQARWNTIDTALHNLYCKELSCQAHQKP